MKIETGRRYILRSGYITGAIQIRYGSNMRSTYRFIDKVSNITFTKDGRYSIYGESQYDIVSEYIKKENKMEQNMCDFSTIKVGDKVWANHLGWTKVAELLEDEFQVEEGDWFYFDGKMSKEDYFPSAFWNIPTIIAPPAPKRKVKKTIEGWVNVYGTVISIKNLHKTKEEADEVADSCRIACIHIKEEYEVEE